MFRIVSKTALIAVAVASLAGAAQAADFKISFTWDGLKLCTSGSPNVVPNPAFVVKGLPAGTQIVQFRLVDLDVPGYDHGGGAVAMTKDGKVPSGAFRYKSPCPPNGKHTYEWTAVAKSKKGFGGKKLGTAKARRKYPE